MAERVNRLVRPPWEEVAKIHAIIQCSCGRTLHMVHETRAHWQLGHFDREGSPMLTEKELLALIFCQIGKVNQAVKPVLRELLWIELSALIFVLNQKKLGSMEEFSGPSKVFELCGIPWEQSADGLHEVPEAWLKEHGFSETDHGTWVHEKF